LDVCRRSAQDRYAANSPNVSVTKTGVDHQNNRVIAWSAVWSTGRASGSCLVSATGQLVRFEEVKSSDNGGPAVQPPVVPVEQPEPAQPAAPTRVVCESKEARRAECAIPLDWQARLVRTMSTNPCVQDRSWGYTERVLWVSSGCRGEFEISARPTTPGGPGYGGATRRLTCGSPVGNQVQCQTGGYASSVRLVRDLSGNNRCRQGQSWGYTSAYVWTKAGCRGDFEVAYGNAGGPVSGNRRLTCGTGTTSQAQCPTGGYATSVRLVRDLSGNRCRQNTNWGYTDSFIWTNAYCRAEFEVGYGGATGPATPRPPVTPATRTITCGNSYGAQMSCNAFGQVANVRMTRDLSNGRCRQGATWGFSQQDLWVKDGCYADFQVTYAGLQPMAR
jgi:hypothetical protein